MVSRSTGAAAPAFLALACVGSFASLPAHAAGADDDKKSSNTSADDNGTQDRDSILVTGERSPKKQESPKATRPVRDTPQTVTILSGEVIEEQNLLTLRDVLSTVPGITFGAGEGGGGYGDSITLRGFSANTDITVDGVRDSAQYTRTDPFNLEQLEVTNGPNSVTNGAGSVGGNINIVTKKPQRETRMAIGAGIGTDNYYRGTVDANWRASELVAVRLNAMAHKNDVPGRDVEDYKRWGVAPSITLGIESPTRLTLQYLHQEDTNIPQYGVPYYSGEVPGVDRSSYYGYRNVDTQEITVDQATATFEHDLSDRVSIRNLTRWQRVDQLSYVDPPQGTYCVAATNLTPTGASCGTTPAGYYLPSGPRGNARNSRNDLMYDQIDLKAEFDTAGLKHTLTFGASATWEKYFLSTGNFLRNSDGTAFYTTYPLINIANPNEVVTGPAATGRVYGSNVYTGPVNFIESARQTGELENYAAYLFDTIELVKGIEFNGGVRIEKNKGFYRADTVSTAAATLGQVTTGTRFDNDDTLFSYRAGLVFKPIEAVSLYVAYGNSQTPSKTSVNGSCTVATCNVDPETAKNYEIGAKAELFHGGLLLTVAAFRNDRDKYKVASNDPTIPDQVLDGHSRVDGISLGATGRITSAWTVTANYTYLDAKLIQSVSDYCLANPGSTGCGNTTANPDPAAGVELANTPKNSGSLYTTYTLPFGLKLGYGFTYQGSFAFSAAAGSIRSDDYLIHNALISYDFTPNFSAQINVKNFTDELYYTRIRNNGWATPGDARSAILTVNYKF
ncbi:TonB-dependent receptor [Sphingomonas sp. HITSZ_GF]|uniref:TonB-dependent receptor n=1 Tax=Sphingomonas sp. HITSZ_GF TaxID=3037247 RepID=UPI00240E8D54|nr:TonB-dependent receptor [Sphingomonas sp. HITSZ_GF]MDG2535529.1 TonB-dependent receptor [Sphingomonas sp. HITSZ_GF]